MAILPTLTTLFASSSRFKPDEIYNLAAMSHVAVSFETPEYTDSI